MAKVAPKSKKKNPPAAQQQPAQEAPPQSTGVPDGQSVDRIRDIIFGAQMRDYEERFQKLERRLLQEAQDLRNDVKQRFESLQATLSKESAGLSSDLKDERNKRAKSDAEVIQKLQDVNRALQEKMDGQGGETSQHLDRIGKRISQEATRLSAAIESTAQKLSKQIEELRLAKTDRAALASLLANVADNLRSDPKRSE